MKYENNICAVCGETFTAESDVVVCPDCGTPHHRDCYKELGHCENADKHASDFVWKSPESIIAEENKSAAKPSPVAETVTNSRVAPNGAIPALEIDREGNTRAVYRAINGKEKIGDYTVEEYGKVIQKNTHKYIPKFVIMDRTGRKWSWNWAAFFFGPYWLFFRKMYKYGAIALLLSAIIPLIFIGDVIKFGDEYTAVYTKVAEIMMSDAGTDQAELESKLNAAVADMPKEPGAMTAAGYLQMAVCAALGIFGNTLYKDHCTKLISKAKEKKQNPEELERFLKKNGGRSVVPVVVAYLSLAALTFLVTDIYLTYGADLAAVIRRYI